MNWPYTKRPDGKISVTLDNNVWNFLFERQIRLSEELCADKFALFITREVEIETLAIPRGGSKDALKNYIQETIETAGIQTTYVFGFASSGPGPQRVGGFDQGTWQSQTEREFYAAIRERFLLGKSEKRSQLTDNEADAAIAAQSFFSVALTCEKPTKVGPLQFAAEHGGKVAYLGAFDTQSLPLKDYIREIHERL